MHNLKNTKQTPEQVYADLVFMLQQSCLIEHEQNHGKISDLRRKYGISFTNTDYTNNR